MMSGVRVVFQPLQTIAQGELALFQSLNLQLIDVAHGEQGVDGRLQIAVLEPQVLDFRDDSVLFGVAGFVGHGRLAVRTPPEAAAGGITPARLRLSPLLARLLQGAEIIVNPVPFWGAAAPHFRLQAVVNVSNSSVRAPRPGLGFQEVADVLARPCRRTGTPSRGPPRREIEQERLRPSGNDMKLFELKKKKLQIKDEISKLRDSETLH